MDQKNLDELFREKFKTFREVPDEKVWTAIDRSLDKKRKKRVIPLWWKLGGVAAVLVIALIAFYPFDDNSDTAPAVTDTENTKDDGRGRERFDTTKENDATREADNGTETNPALKKDRENILHDRKTSDEAVANSSADRPSEIGEDGNTERYKKSDNEDFSVKEDGIVGSDTEPEITSSQNKIRMDSGDRYPENTQLTEAERDGDKQRSDSSDPNGADGPILKKNGTELIGNKNTEALASSESDTNQNSDPLATKKEGKNRDGTLINQENTGLALGQGREKQERKKQNGEKLKNEKVAQNEKPDEFANQTEGATETSEITDKTPESEVADKTVEDSDKTSEVAENDNDDKKSIFEALEQQADEENIAEESDTRWSAGPSVAPVYFNAMGEGSPIDPGFAANSKSGGTNLSYGLSVAYAINDKLSVRSGIHKSEYGYDTNDVGFSPTLEASSSGRLQNIDYSNGSENLAVNNSLSDSESLGNLSSEFGSLNSIRDGTVAQSFGYLEVPLELDYAIIDRKFGVKLIGGVSSLFLLDNSVTLSSEDLQTDIGEASNLNDFNFSTNIGFGVNYKFTPKIQLNIEPVFKYQLNTFSDTSGDFRPYSIGVYSGLNFRF